MAKIKITHKHTQSDEAVLQAARGLASRLENEHGLSCEWSKHGATMKGKGVSGRLLIAPGQIEIEVTLGLAMSLFKGLVEKEMRDYLSRHLS
jgi:putative polyhydroxyalkanoate system protein